MEEGMSTVPDSQQDIALAALREQLEDLIGRCYVADDPHGACDETMQLIDRYSSERADREKAKAVREARIDELEENIELTFDVSNSDDYKAGFQEAVRQLDEFTNRRLASLTSGEDT
jgi:hypothetical protein